MKKFPLQLDKTLCISCGACSGECSFGALNFEGEYPSIDPAACRLCGACVKGCPVGALTLEETKATAKPLDESNGIWVFVEYSGGKFEDVSLELLSKARELSKESSQMVTAIVLGSLAPHQSAMLYAYGADRVINVEDKRYELMIEENYTRTIASLAKKYDPSVLLIGATPWGRSLSARLAATLQTGLTADCTALSLEPKSGLLLQRRPAFGGHLMATIKCSHHRPQMASVRPHIFSAESQEPKAETSYISEPAKECFFKDRVKCIEVSDAVVEALSLHDSKIIIGVGRGVKNQETLEQIERLAQKLNAKVGGTRGAVEMGLIDSHYQIGQTGTAISAQCYIALGVSGQIQHTSGIGNCQKIIAINTDPQAPIFRCADYGVVGDVAKWVNDMLEAL